MVAIWSPEAKVVSERRLWLAVVAAARQSWGSGYRFGASPTTNVWSTMWIWPHLSPAVLRHDVKARIEEFNALAGHTAQG